MSTGLVIHISSGDDRHTEILTDDSVRIGTSESCDLRLRSSSLPKTAANTVLLELTRANGSYRVSDSNGSVPLALNGEPVTSGSEIRDGDELLEPEPGVSNFPLTDFLAQMGQETRPPQGGTTTCEYCGLGLSDFRKTGRLVTVEENVFLGGFGAGVLELLATHGLVIPVRPLGVPDRIFEQASQSRLREQAGLTPDGIAAAARAVVAARAATRGEIEAVVEPSEALASLPGSLARAAPS